MISRFALSLLATVLATGGYAEPVRVISGEHPDFSRLVVFMPSGSDWQLEELDSTKYQLRIVGQEDFDTRTVFDLIPKSRLQALAVSNGQLVLTLGCNCPISQDVIPSGQLVLDILNPVSEEEMSSEKSDTADAEQESDGDVQQSFPLAAVQPNGTSRIDPSPFWKRPQSNDEKPVEDETQPALDEFREDLIKSLGRAASLTLVEVPEQEVPKIGMSADKASDEGKDEKPEMVLEMSSEDIVSEEKQPRFRTSSAAERARAPETTVEEPVPSCYRADYFAIADWGDPEAAFGDQISDARRSLSGEFDRTKPSDALKLMRLYLYYGLVEEAHKIYRVFQLDSKAAQAALVISEILLMREVDPFIATMTDCEGMLSIWATLAGPVGQAITKEQSRRVTAEFAKLPSQLKTMFGADLLLRFTQGGDKTGAGIIRNALKRSVGDDAPLLSSPMAELSEDDLLAVMQDDRKEAPQALAELIGRGLSKEEPIEAGLIELADTLAFEGRGTEEAAELQQLRVRAFTHNAAHREAFRAWEEIVPEQPEAAKTIGSVILDKLLKDGPASEIVQVAGRLIGSETHRALTDEDRVSFSLRLASLGMAELGAAFSDDVEASKKARLGTLVETLSGGDVALAPDFLASLDAVSRKRIAGRLVEKDEAELAWEYFSGQLDEEARQNLAAAAGIWGEVDPGSEFAGLANFSGSDQATDSMSDQPLSNAQSMLDDARRAREDISRLLGSELNGS